MNFVSEEYHASQTDMVTSFLIHELSWVSWVAPVEKVPPLGSNASCDDPSSMPSSGESREQSEAGSGS